MHYPGGYFTPRKSDLLSFVRVLHPLTPFPQQLYRFSFVLVYNGKSYCLGTLIEPNHATIVNELWQNVPSKVPLSKRGNVLDIQWRGFGIWSSNEEYYDVQYYKPSKPLLLILEGTCKMPWKHTTFFDTLFWSKKIHWVVYECITVNVEEDKIKKEKLEKMDIICTRRGEGSHVFVLEICKKGSK